MSLVREWDFVYFIIHTTMDSREVDLSGSVSSDRMMNLNAHVSKSAHHDAHDGHDRQHRLVCPLHHLSLRRWHAHGGSASESEKNASWLHDRQQILQCTRPLLAESRFLVCRARAS